MLWLLLTLSGVACAAPARAASRALLIDFEASPSSRKVQELAATLQSSGFEVQSPTVPMPLSPDSSAALQRDIQRTAAAGAADDVLLVYVRGFCREQGGRRFLGASPQSPTSDTPTKSLATTTLALSDLIAATAQTPAATLLAIDAIAPQAAVGLTKEDVQSVWMAKTSAAKIGAARQNAVLWSSGPQRADATDSSRRHGLAFFLSQGLAGQAADGQGVVRVGALANYAMHGVFGAAWIEQGEEQVPLAVFSAPAAADAIVARNRPPGNGGQTVLSTEVRTARSDAAPSTVQSTLNAESAPHRDANDALQRACEAWHLGQPREARHWSEMALMLEAQTPPAATSGGEGADRDGAGSRRKLWMARATLLAAMMVRRVEASAASPSPSPSTLSRGASGESLKYFRRALELAPSWWRASFEVGRALQQNGDFEGAAGMFKSALQLDAQRAQSWIELGRLEHLGRKDLTAAKAAFQRALTIAPRDATALNGLANVLFDMSNFAGAARWFGLAVAAQPQRAAWRLNLAWALLHSGRRTEAKREAQRALALASSQGESLPTAHPIWAKVALKAPSSGQPNSAWHAAAPLEVRTQQAAREIEEAEKQLVARQYRLAQLSAHRTLALLDVAPQSLFATSSNTAPNATKADDATARSDETVRSDAGTAPLAARSTALLGRLAATWHNDVMTSRRLLARSLEVHREASVLVDLATLIGTTTTQVSGAASDGANSGDGRTAQALEMLTEAAKLAPNDARPLSGLGEIAYRRFDYATAQKYFEDALKRDERDVRALYGLGEIATNSGRYDEAEKYFARATEVLPQNAVFWNRRGIFASSIRKDVAGAEAHFRRALDADPTFAVAAANLGVLLMNARRDFVGAEPLLRRAVQHAPREGLYHFHLGFCLLQLDRQDEAVAAVKRALELGYNAPHPVLQRLGIKP